VQAKNLYIFYANRGNRTQSIGVSVSQQLCERLVSAQKSAPPMSPILPISLLITVLCLLGAIDGVLDQQLLFVGAAVAATILVCSFEAWSAREATVRAEDERRLRDPADR
jgi:hypothetical protein